MHHLPPLLLETATDVPAWTSHPWAQVAYGVTVALAVIWLGVDAFARWRRQAANLIAVATAEAAAERPEFVKVDTAARAAAKERGDDYERHLRQREAEAKRAAAEQAARKSEGARRTAGSLSVCMSLLTLVSMIAGAVGHIAWIGTAIEEYSALDRLKAVIAAHPVAFAISLFVVVFHVTQFIRLRKWRAAA